MALSNIKDVDLQGAPSRAQVRKPSTDVEAKYDVGHESESKCEVEPQLQPGVETKASHSFEEDTDIEVPDLESDSDTDSSDDEAIQQPTGNAAGATAFSLNLSNLEIEAGFGSKDDDELVFKAVSPTTTGPNFELSAKSSTKSTADRIADETTERIVEAGAKASSLSYSLEFIHGEVSPVLNSGGKIQRPSHTAGFEFNGA